MNPRTGRFAKHLTLEDGKNARTCAHLSPRPRTSHTDRFCQASEDVGGAWFFCECPRLSNNHPCEVSEQISKLVTTIYKEPINEVSKAPEIRAGSRVGRKYENMQSEIDGI